MNDVVSFQCEPGYALQVEERSFLLHRRDNNKHLGGRPPNFVCFFSPSGTLSHFLHARHCAALELPPSALHW